MMKRDRLLVTVFIFPWLVGWPTYGDPPEAPPANVALLSSGADITASDSFGNDTPDELIDGVIDHALTHRWHSEISKGHPHWLRIELARPLPVRRIVLHASAVDCFPTRIAVEYRAADGQVRPLVETTLVPARSVAVDLPAVTTDNLRIRILDSNAGIKGYVQLNALEVLAAIAPDEARELARAAATPPGQNKTVDTKPAMLFAAWTVIRKTGDLDQLRRWVPHLEHLANLMAETADEKDGLLVTVKSTRAGGWYDVVRNEWKSAYGNALGYQAFRQMADLEQLAGRAEQSRRYGGLADRIRQAFVPTLLTPETGVLAGWRDRDGKLHDYWFPWVNGMAITFGLVDDEQADQILGRFQAKFKEVGFNRYDLGLPNCLVQIPKPDYVTEDRFQQYLNGGASPCFAYWYIQALYQRGRRAEADAILWPMVRSFNAMLFNGGVGLGQHHPDRQEWHRWNGERSGGEGFLTDSYLTLNAIYPGHYGIAFGPRGYEVAPWSPLKGKRVPVGLEYMGKVVDETE